LAYSSGSQSDFRHLDWVCIGAQKAGTSTLFRLLESHPDVLIPASKEDPIFHREVTDVEVRDYMTSRFGSAPAGSKCGTVTPHYMFGPEIASRVQRYAPDARIIAILRDPIWRAFSQHRMNIRRGIDTRSFAEVVVEQVNQLRLGNVPDIYDERETLVWRGCYSTILAPWIERYRQKLLVIFTDELDRKQTATLVRVQQHIGVRAAPPPSAVYEHEAPPAHRLSGWRRPLANALRRAGVLDWMPVEPRLRTADALERFFARLLPIAEPSIDSETEAMLRSFYVPDALELTRLIGRVAPWEQR
jgi:hypothetical protein